MKLIGIIVIFFSLVLWPLSLVLTHDNYRYFSIFSFDNQAPLIINNKRSIYPNDLLGRLFNNKVSFVWGKLKNNFFAITDPNNYFFGFHPREIVRENLNIDKFPFISIIFLLYGLLHIDKLKFGKQFLASFFILSGLLSLGNFDEVDFVLYPILAYFMIFGIQKMRKERPKIFLITSFFLIIFSIPQYIHTFVNLTRQ